jgi:hypothetical protein
MNRCLNSCITRLLRFAHADRHNEEVSEGIPETAEASLYADLLGAALQQVNWPEVADHWLDNLDD